MKIAVCDDEEVFTRKIYQFLWQEHDCIVECFLSPEELLKKYDAGERYDVLFLDVLMSPISGMELARKIREWDKYAILIFITAYLEYAPEGYEVNAFRYLLKPVVENDLRLIMTDIRKKLEDSAQTLLFKTPECNLLLHIPEILYLEAANKETLLHCRDDVITLRKSLNELEQQLPETFFFRIHRKFLVNLSHVREYDTLRLTLDSRQTLPVSRRKSREFGLALKAYIEGDIHT
ncbi:MAG: LytTR family DNA-binding domain-containing protein [Acetatifactor sp.]|nr:LytTR family DNA-binding domain-containing protein [Acetatifactor sp.]